MSDFDGKTENGRMKITRKQIWRRWSIFLGPALLSLACLAGGGDATVIPAGPPANFEVQTAAPAASPTQVAATEAPATATKSAVVLTLGDAPTHTPDPNPVATATSTLTITAALSPTAVSTAEPAEEIAAATPEPTTTPTALPPTQAPTPTAAAPAPPLAGGSWDFEEEYVPWPNPYGEPCPGASVASGWTAFAEEGEFGSSCFNENLYGPNVFSGAKSQEITFDFIAASSGVFRIVPTEPGHRYNIVAYAKSDPSLSPVEMSLGIDPTGGTVWSAESVEWFPWDNNTQDTWGATEETVEATGSSMTIFIRGTHPLAEQGGKTIIDNVSITDLGL